MRLFANFERVDFKRGSLLTFELATLRSLLLVVPFGGTKSTYATHFLIGIFSFFRARQNSLRHP